MSTILRAENLVKKYGRNVVVKDACLSLEAGKIYGLLGPNGAGKTTIMKMMVNLLKADGGKIVCEDVKIKYLMDVPKFYEYMKVEEYLMFLLDINKDNNKKEKLDELLTIANLVEHRSKKIRQLSRGLRQKLGIASVLVSDVDVLVLDEPVSALDPLGRKDVLDLIASLRGKIAVVFSSHILEDIEKVCDHIILINKGKIILDDDCSVILKQDEEVLVRCETREQTQLLKSVLENCEFSVSRANTICVKYEDLMKTQQEILKQAKKLKVTVELMEKKKLSLEEVFLEEVRKHG